jgi:hypothetical protein
LAAGGLIATRFNAAPDFRLVDIESLGEMNVSPLPLITMTEVARRVGVGPATMLRRIRAGTVQPDFYSGAAWLFHPTTVTRIARRCERTVGV